MTARTTYPAALVVALLTIGCAELRPDPILANDRDGGSPRPGGADGGGTRAGGCGNGAVEQGETCDPPERCPTSCPAIGCTRRKLEGSAAACTARCVDDEKQTACVAGDSCCPPGCNTANDEDCNCTCGNGMLESACGEKCDPLGSCPSACAPDGCKLRSVVNAGTCQAECVDSGVQTACVHGDGCCPRGCQAGNDSDCKVSCDNGTVEDGETCDPIGACPTSCPPVGCTRRKLEGSATACTARCLEDGLETTCRSGDGCCPGGCTTANDTDCQCTCGNGVREQVCGETCDPLGSCPGECPWMGCKRRKLVNGGTCQARCIDDGTQTACQGGDRCCPTACNATNDSDCSPRCNNGTIESGETCDPLSSCSTTCPWMGCMRWRLEGAAAMCTARCVESGAQTACAQGDGCCPPACNFNNDNDCQPRCGNAVIEGNETCDGNCPNACPAMGCQRRKLEGSAVQCTARCVNDTVIATCSSGDGCCPQMCNSTNDAECMCRCGNGVVESACQETCESGNCPTSCPAMGCQARVLMGSAAACNARCANDGPPRTTCAAASDGCCSPSCNATNDGDCRPVCGNGAVEMGETCDPPGPMGCQTQSDMCVGDANTIRMPGGRVDNCTFSCSSSARPCRGSPDSFCPSACTHCTGTSCSGNQDIDCPRPEPPPPPPPPACPSGQRCCEPDFQGGCFICIPNNRLCP